MSKFTPTPWEGKHCSDGYGVFSGGVMVARINNTVGEFNQELVNADFIVTACNSHYELLEALKKFVSSFASGQREKCDIALQTAKQAISKAENKCAVTLPVNK